MSDVVNALEIFVWVSKVAIQSDWSAICQHLWTEKYIFLLVGRLISFCWFVFVRVSGPVNHVGQAGLF